jgi:hypothetical protein
VVWTGGFSKGVHRWEGGKLTTWNQQNSSLPSDDIHTAAEPLDGRALWVGTGAEAPYASSPTARGRSSGRARAASSTTT